MLRPFSEQNTRFFKKKNSKNIVPTIILFYKFFKMSKPVVIKKLKMAAKCWSGRIRPDEYSPHIQRS
jgi:hypothetical protein